MTPSNTNTSGAAAPAAVAKPQEGDRQTQAWATEAGVGAPLAGGLFLPTDNSAGKAAGRKRLVNARAEDESEGVVAAASAETELAQTGGVAQAQARDPGPADWDRALHPVTADRGGDRESVAWSRESTGDGGGFLGVNSFYGLLGGGLALGVAIGGGGTGGAAVAAVAASPPVKVLVQDGLIKGATVYIDRNGLGAADPGNKVGVTDDAGVLQLSDVASLDLTKPLIAIGGVNIDTGLPNTLTLVLSSGLTGVGLSVISPVTTLVASLCAQGLSVGAAEVAVKTALGLSSALDLSSFDPLSAVNAGSPDALKLQQAGAQLASLGSDALLADGAFGTLASYILDHSGAVVNLADLDSLQAIYGGSDAAINRELADVAATNLHIIQAVSPAAVAAVQVQAAAPQILGLQADTGSDATDKITADSRLLVSGLNAASTIEYSVDGGANWIAQSQFAPADGELTVLARLHYDNGVIAAASDPFMFTLDTAAPAPLSLTLASDTGASATDHITKQAGIAVGGLAAGALIEYSTDQASWSPSMPVWVDGRHDLYARQSFPLSGGVSLSSKLSFTLDTVALAGSAGLAANTPELINDTGADSTDGITSNVLPILSGQAEAGTTAISVTLFRDDPGNPLAASSAFLNADDYQVAAADIQADGHWTLALTQALGDGVYKPLVTVTDAAGNVSAPTWMDPITIDTVAPEAGTAALASASDSGFAFDDGLTQVTRPTIEGLAEAHASVQVDIDGTVYSALADANGRWSLVVMQALEDGEYTPSITIMDQAGNLSEAVDGSSFTVQSTGPLDSGVGGLIQDEEFDTGLSAEDGITSNNLPLLTGSVDAGVVVIVKLGDYTYATVADDSGEWSIQVPEGQELEDGTYVPGILYIDAAGNQTPVSGAPITIDTEASSDVSGELVHDEENDTGAASDDGLTNNASPTLQGTAEAGALVSVDLNGNVLETLADEDGYWQLTADGLDDGEYTPLITVTDAAGNVGDAIEGVAFTVDTTGPEEAVGELVHDDVNDTGVATDDGLTANNLPEFSGTAEADALVSLDLNGTVFETQADSDGNWTLQVDQALDDGEYTPLISVSDATGNVTETEGAPFTIDTEAPTADSVSGGLLADEDNDTGLSQDDGITANNAPVLSGTADALALIQVELDGNVFDTQADEDGYWELSLDTLDDGEYTPLITVIDAAGNTSEPIEGVLIVIDTEGPSDVSGGLRQDDLNDTGLANDDGITRNARPTLAGSADPGAFVVVEIGDNNYETEVDAQGQWTLRIPDELPDGEYTPLISVTDPAGNISDSIEGALIVIDTGLAELSGGLSHDEDNDTGVASDDGITNNNIPTLGGTAEAGALVVVTLNGQRYETLADEDGLWVVQVEETLPDGVYTPIIEVTDAAGNTGTAAGESLTVDTVASLEGGDIGVHRVFQVGDKIDFNPFGAIPPAEGDTVEDYGGGLAEGLGIDDLSYHIVGTPTATGTTFITMNSSDLAGNSATSYFQLVVTAAEKGVVTVNNIDTEKAATYLGTDSGEHLNVLASANDVLLAGGGDDLFQIFREEGQGFARIDGGAGFDRVSFSGTDLEFDFSDFNNPDGSGRVIEHVEAFSFGGRDSSLSITAADLFHLRSDALDVDGVHQVVRFMAGSTNGGSVTLEDLTQVGETDAFGATGDKTTGASSDKYTKFTGVYTDMSGDHLVELLLQHGLTA